MTTDEFPYVTRDGVRFTSLAAASVAQVNAYYEPRDDESQRVEALRYFGGGIPSALPKSNQFRGLVENHRWGRHPAPAPGCPACEDTVTRVT